MVRPTSTRDAKKGSKEQADNVIQMDIWGMLAGEEEEETDTAEVEEEEIDDLPM